MRWLVAGFLLVVLLMVAGSIRFAYTSAKNLDGGGYPILGYPVSSLILLLLSAGMLRAHGDLLAMTVAVGALPFAALHVGFLVLAERRGSARRLRDRARDG